MNRSVWRLTMVLAVILTVSACTTAVTEERLSPEARAMQQEALNYLNSPERHEDFTRTFDPAAERLTRALDEGKLGKATRLPGDGDEEERDFIGTANLTADALPRVLVGVHLQPDGSIDYEHSFSSLQVDTAEALGVRIHRDNGRYPWSAALEVDNPDPSPAVEVWNTYTCIGTDKAQFEPDVACPETLAELQAIDQQVLGALEQNMVALFGPDWRKQI